MHHVERTGRWKHFGSPRFDEGRDGPVGDGHGVRDAETALDPVDVVAKESVKRFQCDATIFVGQNLLKILLSFTHVTKLFEIGDDFLILISAIELFHL